MVALLLSQAGATRVCLGDCDREFKSCLGVAQMNDGARQMSGTAAPSTFPVDSANCRHSADTCREQCKSDQADRELQQQIERERAESAARREEPLAPAAPAPPPSRSALPTTPPDSQACVAPAKVTGKKLDEFIAQQKECETGIKDRGETGEVARAICACVNGMAMTIAGARKLADSEITFCMELADRTRPAAGASQPVPKMGVGLRPTTKPKN
jgi:hypothetical protein